MEYKSLATYIESFKNLGILKTCDLADDLLKQKIECVSYDNRKLSGTSLFICKGNNFLPEYAKSAVDSGAVAYISQEKIDGLNCGIIVDDIRAAIVACAKIFYDNAPAKIKTIGITGTKGKGCVLYFLREILNSYLQENNKKDCAYLSSIRSYDGIIDEESHLTTPETLELYEHFYNANKSGIEYLIIQAILELSKICNFDAK